MIETLKIIVPATIALLGIVVGYYQWKRSQVQKRYDAFVDENRTTYRELWNKLEDVHVKLRTNDVTLESFRNLVTDVNSFILLFILTRPRSNSIEPIPQSPLRFRDAHQTIWRRTGERGDGFNTRDTARCYEKCERNQSRATGCRRNT